MRDSTLREFVEAVHCKKTVYGAPSLALKTLQV